MSLVEVTRENFNSCLCGACPTFGECSREREESLYCGVGRSECFLEKEGCLCPECPIYSSYQLMGLYFCLEGEAPSCCPPPGREARKIPRHS